LAFSTILEGTSGVFNVFTGTGASFATPTAAFTGANSATGLRFGLGVSTVTGSFRAGSSWSTSGLDTTGLAQNTVLAFRILGNKLHIFDLGVHTGRSMGIPDIALIPIEELRSYSVGQARRELKINADELRKIYVQEKTLNPKSLESGRLPG
ncbi:MAG: hypothetical protein ACKO8U_10285, partial [Pirellula sp.]